MSKLTKFSKMRPKNDFDEPKDEIKYEDDTLKIIKYENWSILKERDAVVCIPYLIESNQVILRWEYIPTFKYVDGNEYHVTLVCGGIEVGETPEMAMIRELEEEAGIVLREDFKLEPLKPLFMSKVSVNKFHPYIIPLNERDYHEVLAKGDGSDAESKSKSVKVDVKFLKSVNSADLITDYMLLKLKEYLNV